MTCAAHFGRGEVFVVVVAAIVGIVRIPVTFVAVIVRRRQYIVTISLLVLWQFARTAQFVRGEVFVVIMAASPWMDGVPVTFVASRICGSHYIVTSSLFALRGFARTAHFGRGEVFVVVMAAIVGVVDIPVTFVAM